MKLKLWDRIALRVGGLIAFLAGAAAVVAGIMLYGHDMGTERVMHLIPFALIASGILCAVYALYTVVLPRRYAVRRHAFVVQATELGELRIAVSAIENLILKCVETHKEVKVQDMTIRNRKGAVNVAMLVTMNSNVSIPHAVEQLQTQIKRYLAASSGIEVRDISVAVERAAGEEAILPLKEEAVPAVNENEDKPVEKEKIPMHQRLFGRKEQPDEDTCVQDIPSEEEAPIEQTANAEADAEAVQDVCDDTEDEEDAVAAAEEGTEGDNE